MNRLAPGTQRRLMLTAAWLFGIFLVIAFVFRRLDASQETLGAIAGIAAYVFLAAAIFILWRGWRLGNQDAGAAARRFVSGHPGVAAAVGDPVEVGEPEGEVPSGSGAAQANLVVPVSGMQDEGRVDLVMARIGRHWEVLSATLLVDGDRVRLAEGLSESSTDDDDWEERTVADSSMGLHEAREELSAATLDRHRAIVSIMEELEAIDWYDQRVDATDDPELAAVLAHNRDEEKEHAAMTLEWLRRHDPVLDRAPAHVPVHRGLDPRDRGRGRARAAASGRRVASGDGSLGIGSLRTCRGSIADEPPPARARADLRCGLGARSTTRPRRTLRHFLAARKLVDFTGPLGWDALGDQPRPRRPTRTTARPTAWSAGIRQVQPLVELRTPVHARPRPSSTRSTAARRDADLDPVVDAARRVALAEDTLVFDGYPRAGHRAASCRASPHDADRAQRPTTTSTRTTSPRRSATLQARRRRRPVRHRPRARAATPASSRPPRRAATRCSSTSA